MLSAKEVPVLEIADENGSLGLFKVASEWEGFKKLESLKDGEVLIVAPKHQGGTICAFEDLFGSVFGKTYLKEMVLVSASPNLIFRLRAHLNQGVSGKGDSND